MVQNDGTRTSGVERLLTVDEVAERLHLSRSKTWYLVSQGDLPSLTIGRSRRVAESALARFIEEREAASRPPVDKKMAASDSNSETAVEARHGATEPLG